VVGFPDVRQLHERPITPSGLEQLADEQPVHHHDEIHVHGVAMPIEKLTFTHAEFPFPVPVKRLNAWPAIAIHHQDPFLF
jgi:hypothetical protein